MTLFRGAVALVLAALAACASDPGGDDVVDTPPDPISVRWGPIEVQPGVEAVQCVNVRLGNLDPLKVYEIHNVLGDISHHYIVYKTFETEEYSTPRDCSSVESLVDPDVAVPLMITQKSEETLTLPDGVAFDLGPDTMLKLELHYINAGTEPKTVQVDTTLVPMAESDFVDAADFVFIGNPDIWVNPGQSVTLESTFPMPWELLGANIFGITGHEHHYGTNVYVELEDNGTKTPIYDLANFNWDEPETVRYDPPMPLPESGQFNFTCEWFNSGSSQVTFGEGVNDEMCFFWAYYYPSRGAAVCFHTERLDQPLDICCPGNQLCGLIDDYLHNN